MAIQQLDVEALRAWIDEGRSFVLLDVREAHELALAALPDAVHIPLRSLPGRALSELDPDATIAVLCHHGVRSMAAAAWLVEHDFSEVHNITGGIDRYSTIDASIPRY